MKKCEHCGVIDLEDYEAKQVAEIHMLAPVTTAKLSKHYRISLTNASNRLRKWFLLGFLSRTKDVQPSGGTEYIYTIPKAAKRKP